MSKREVKKVQSHLADVEIKGLEKLIVLVAETDDLLEGLEADSIKDFENNVNALTQFTNPMISAQAFNLDAQYKRLLELEKQINGKLKSEDLTSTKELKSSVIANIKEKHTIYYTTAELKLKTRLEKIIKDFNGLSFNDRKNIGLNRSGELAFTVYSSLIL